VSSLQDPDVVRREYATEAGLATRRALYDNRVGPDPRDVMWDEIVAAAPRRVLEVGPGPGEVSERMQRELGVEVVAIDVSERMVELARWRGVDARVGDAQELPFADGEFDLVVAAWVLFHYADLDHGLAEIARVLRPGGRLVAVTNSEEHLGEARAHAGFTMVGRLSFSRENGEESLRRHFTRVRRKDVDGRLTFPDADAIRAYMRTLILGKMGFSGEDVPELDEPLRATTRNTVFVAES
jgi:SAM-dependent methyltransferase